MSRKSDHLELCFTNDVAFRKKGTLLSEVTLIHNALPQLAFSDIDLSTTLVGTTIAAPLVIAAMTGGIDEAERINRDLAAVAQEHGIAFGFGSMRPLVERGILKGYQVRTEAPDILLLGNIGIVQAAALSPQALDDLIGSTDINALVVHLNPAMEAIQEGGDDNFRNGLDTISRLRHDLPIPLIVKETGCGLSRSVGRQLARVGISTVDVSGAGGTSWVGVETLRSKSPLGETFWEWGIPTAGSVAQLSGFKFDIIATGGMRNGLDVARAITLGATAGGMARIFLQAWREGGQKRASLFAKGVIDEIRLAHLLTGSPSPDILRMQPLVLGPKLLQWVPADCPLRARLSQ